MQDRRGEADALSLLGNLYLAERNTAQAAEAHERALALYRALRDQLREAGSLANRGAVYELQGLPQEAREAQQKAIFLLQAQVQ
jgi:tetratricopeptide (TPR) repeat protein